MGQDVKVYYNKYLWSFVKHASVPFWRGKIKINLTNIFEYINMLQSIQPAIVSNRLQHYRPDGVDPHTELHWTFGASNVALSVQPQNNKQTFIHMSTAIAIGQQFYSSLCHSLPDSLHSLNIKHMPANNVASDCCVYWTSSVSLIR